MTKVVSKKDHSYIIEQTQKEIETQITSALRHRAYSMEEYAVRIKDLLTTQVCNVNPGLEICTEAIHLVPHEGNNHEIFAGNFYTALLIQGIVVDYSEIKGKNEYIVPKDTPYFGGSKFIWEDNELYIKPVKPLKYIKGEFTVDKSFFPDSIK